MTYIIFRDKVTDAIELHNIKCISKQCHQGNVDAREVENNQNDKQVIKTSSSKSFFLCGLNCINLRISYTFLVPGFYIPAKLWYVVGSFAQIKKET